jgi:AcrR family transcriptional regulator
MSADQRREEILEIALRHFAIGGYHGTSTETIAREAGISQPYLFRLFGTKKELFLGCVGRSHDLVMETFETAAAAAEPGEVLAEMGKAYVERLLPDRHALLMQMQGYVAASEPEIQERVRACFSDLRQRVAELSGAPDDLLRAFFAEGMLLNVTAALDLPIEPRPLPEVARP